MRTVLRSLRASSREEAMRCMERCLDALESYLSAIEYGERFERLADLRAEAIERLDDLERFCGTILVKRRLKL